MDIALHALGIGSGAQRHVIDAVARAAEAAGFSTLWAGEHVVMVDAPQSRYPYADDGRIAVPADSDWLDPMIALSFAAAVTSRIRLATGVLLLAEHSPVVIAKQAASLDVLSGGRFTLGVGAGWSREEFDALGVPFERRGRRLAEYVQAMRVLWREDVASVAGEFVSFDRVRVNPKPMRERTLPVVFGGHSDVALDRAARLGDGWYGFNLRGIGELANRITVLRERCEVAGRSHGDLRVSVALRTPHPDLGPALEELGVDELALVDSPPDDLALVDQWITRVARRWGV